MNLTQDKNDPNIFYANYIPLEHTEESLKEYRIIMDKYYKKHNCCPVCGSKRAITTLIGYPLVKGKESEFKDLNLVTCSECGYKCKCHDRVEEICNHENSYCFHENSCQYCPDCKKYF